MPPSDITVSFLYPKLPTKLLWAHKKPGNKPSLLKKEGSAGVKKKRIFYFKTNSYHNII
jgi:hypothetical protein